MDAKESKEIIRAGFAWAGWNEEQKEAFKFAYNAIDKVIELQKQVEYWQRVHREDCGELQLEIAELKRNCEE